GVARWDPDSLDQVWLDLGGRDVRAAYQAIAILKGSPDKALTFLQQRLDAFLNADEGDRLRQLIADLDHEDYATRELASAGLRRMRRVAEGLLRKALAESSSAEASKRIRILLAEKTPVSVSESDELRMLRVIQVLEALAKPGAHALLEAIARDFQSARIMREAQRSMQRLEARLP
ncbi:MAG: hypothetical protein N2C14_06595, partial [Planctomycetales bacterium]